MLPPTQPQAPLPLPPQYAQSASDLPPELQQHLQQQQLAAMGMAYGQARPGALGEAIARASAMPGAASDQAVQEYRKWQDQEYQRNIARADWMTWERKLELLESKISEATLRRLYL